MSVDARIRVGLSTIDQALPRVDVREGYAGLEGAIRSRDRRRRALVGAVAAAVLAFTAGALVLHHPQQHVSPSPSPDLPNRVTRFDASGRVSYVAADGSALTIPAKDIDRFALSPDGRQIAYTTSDNGGSTRTLWIAHADGSDPHALPPPCSGCQPGYGLSWSHDGARLAYVVWTPGQTPSQLHVRSLATGQEQVFRMPRGLEPRGPSFSPDDTSLAMTMVGQAGQYVATLALTGGASTPTRIGRVYSQVVAPAWSRDGRTVYFTATTSGESSADVTASTDLYAIHADGSGLRQITHAAPGVRFFGVVPYRDEFLVSRAVGDGAWTVGWVSADGSSFTPMTGPDGKPVLGNAPELQP